MRRERSIHQPGGGEPPHGRRIHQEPHDVYGIRGKLPEPTVCPECGAIYREGRWVWDTTAAGGHESLCPACRRIQDDYPAGIVTIGGSFVGAHRDEIQNLARNLEQRECVEHPLVRLFPIQEGESELCIRTTDARLARAIGRALHHAYHGELDEPDSGSEAPIRVRWTRD